MAAVVDQLEIPGLPLFRRGKVRETFDLGDALLMVATDRISAYDSVLPTGIPDKGIVLTQLSRFWFERTRDLVPNHLITTDLSDLPAAAQPFREQLEGRSMVVKKAERIDIECVVRGYLAGSAWAEYRREGTVCGIRLPEGLTECAKLDEPIFTPAAKADTGHDENITFERMVDLVGRDLAERLREATLTIYRAAEEYARTRGIIIADTKLEFGLVDGELTIIDELLTPDSSRFWDAERYQPGRDQPSFDKQFVRDWLTQSGWDREPPAPPLPPEVVEATAAKYREAYERITGRPLFPLS
ncbi:phosphoribosylaminoimidazolesuccinocarboxamide synthase [Sphaerobacter thermophilus]|uniref:Phosphoribosylaminoimidazole-succinocarboxamide synthase n=1 Tax=Sphaerobacter thermophilus (strain ATCC 49802 / DSM 20745 / KCCM 41009 / NCIMB 13125 / S 6022) TaxID=479434 RepID=D1C3B0_SPHTD|nr:phosphoribosylaminoimidazolesuccinocarboxamide synthase [Sphaerobacter thermophilus]ACZ38727.1 phosphoribosylaminoimidazole-succinocarboxamide synthase [Sphaerobacter thermophilus DSM 20745]PZN67365.1 MAG: phosphoribosylaminoimidazolesuccinocarboxamide synthase [Sphaerobacter thermophilus]